MADISRIRVDSTTYDLKDARLPAPGADGTMLVADDGAWTVGTVGNDAPVESGTGVGSVQTKSYEYTIGGTMTYTQNAKGRGSFAEGSKTTALGTSSHAEGDNSGAYGSASHAEGYLTKTFGAYSHAEGGSGTGGSGSIRVTAVVNASQHIYSVASIPSGFEKDFILYKIDGDTCWSARVVSVDSSALQITIDKTIPSYDNVSYSYEKCGAYGGHSHTEGYDTAALGSHAHSEGNSTTAGGNYSHSEGNLTSASGVESHAEGWKTKANGEGSHSEGVQTIAKSLASHAEGKLGVAVGTAAHVEGTGSIITITPIRMADTSGWNRWELESIPSGLAVGQYVETSTGLTTITSISTSNNIIRLNNNYPLELNAPNNVYTHVADGGAHAEGQNTIATGVAHAEGYDTFARGKGAHAEGIGTITTQTASDRPQHVEGYYNIVDDNCIHIVGNGTASTRSNAYTLGRDGSGWFAGTVSAGTVANPAPVTNANDLATKSYVDTQVSYKMSQPDGWGEGDFLTLNSVTGQPEWAAPAGGDSPVESGSGAGSVQTKAFLDGTTTKTQVAYGVGSMAEGAGTYAIGICSHAEGYCSSSLGEITVTAEINSSLYSPVYSVASLPTSFHVGCCILGTYQNVPVGRKVQAINTATLQITLDGRLDNYDSYTYSYTGQGALGPYSHIEGRGIVASGNSSHAEGYGAARGDMSHAEGDSTAANGQASHAEGSATKAQNQYSHAEGYGTVAIADGAHVEGAYGRATGRYAHAEGWDDFWYHTISASSLSLVSGTTYRLNVSQWPYCLNVGCILAQRYDSTTYYKVTAIDTNARTITLDNNLSNTTGTYYVFTLVAVGDGSHAEGSSVAMASYSHAEGEFCVSSGSSSHSEGYNTIAKGSCQHVEGKYNVEDTDNKYAHITGIGTSATSRKNGFTVDWNGNGAFASSVQTPKVDTQYLQVGYNGQGGQAFGQALTHGGVIEGTGVLANIGHVEGTPNLLAIGRMYITGSYTSYNYDPNDSQIANTIKNAYTGCILHIPSLGLYGILESLDTDNNSIVVQYLDEEITDPTLAYLYNPNIYGENSHAEGEGSTVLSRYSHAEGSGTTVGGVTLTVQDTIDHHLDVVPYFNNTPRMGKYSHAEGYRTSIIGQYAHAQGFMSQVFGNAAHAGGLFSVAYGNGSTANAAAGMISVHDVDEFMGYGWYSRKLTLTARLSDPEYTDDYDGDGAYSRRFSFVDSGASSGIQPGMVAIYQVGVYKLARKILSIDFTSHIVVFDGPLPFENISTQNTIEFTVYAAAASGEASHCEGLATVAGGDYSHAEGECTVALGEGQHVSGRANIVDTNNTYASIVGNGTFTSEYSEGDSEFSINVNNRSNAYTLDWSGNGWFAGNITANGGSLTLHDNTGDVTVTAAQLRQLLAMLS